MNLLNPGLVYCLYLLLPWVIWSMTLFVAIFLFLSASPLALLWLPLVQPFSTNGWKEIQLDNGNVGWVSEAFTVDV